MTLALRSTSVLGVSYEEEDEDERYGRARRVLPGLLGSSRRREQFLTVVTACALLFVGFMWLRTNSQLAAAKLEKSQGWVVVLDGKGEAVQLPVASANDWRLADGMVVERLARTVRCMHGLDPVPQVVRKCWEEVAPLFYGADAVTRFEAFNKERFPKVDDILRQQQVETVSVDVQSWAKPETAAPNRYWMRWKRSRIPRGAGTATTEMWSGTFDIELVPITRDNVSGMRIVRWEWHQDLTGAGKGAG